MEKLIKNGMVAVLYSYGFGAGWYTWNEKYPEMVFHPRIVQAVLDGDTKKAGEIAEELFPDCYTGGASQLRVMWVEEGTEFEIEEYDGSETVHVIGSREYLKA